MLHNRLMHALYCASLLALVGCNPQEAPRPAAVLAPEDLHAPELFLALQDGEDLAIIDTGLRRALNNESEASPTLETALALLRYVAQTTRLEYLGSPLGSACLAAGHGYCMDMAQAFVVLCRRVGIPARVNAFHNFEWMMAHNGAEVYLEGQWRFMDPTYGVFVRETSGEDGPVASLAAILEDATLLENACMVSAADHLWSGAHRPDDGIRPLEKDFQYGDYDFTLGELYGRVQAMSGPVLYSEYDTAQFPLVLEWTQSETLQWGERDGEPFDLLGRRNDGRYPRFRGWPFLGNMRYGISEWDIRLHDAPPGAYMLQLELIQHRGAAPEIAETKNVDIAGFERKGKRWTIWLETTGEPASLRLRLPEGSASFDALRFQEDTESS